MHSTKMEFGIDLGVNVRLRGYISEATGYGMDLACELSTLRSRLIVGSGYVRDIDSFRGIELT